MDIFPRCDVCHQQFTLKGPAPYLLPCLHAVCETCVTSAAGGVISCSTCQREVNLTDTSLKKDAVRQKEIFHLTVKHCPTELLCTNEDDGNQAVCWCRECDEFLCEYCQNMHSNVKLTRKHVLQNLGDFKPVVSNIPTPCSIHSHDSLHLFDRKCNILICGRCRFEDHADHEVEKLEVVAEGILTQLNQHKTELATFQARQIQNIRQGTEITDTTHTMLTENIGHTLRSLRSQLDQREKELLTSLRTQINTCEETSKKCSEVLDYISKVLVYASHSDLLELERFVGEASRTFLDTVETQTQDITAFAFNTTGLSKLKSNISRFGAVTTKKMEEVYAKDKETQTEHDCMAMEIKYKNTIDDIEKKCSDTIDFLIGLNCDLHRLKPGAVDKLMVLKCTPLKYDADKLNCHAASINTEGDLVHTTSMVFGAQIFEVGQKVIPSDPMRYGRAHYVGNARLKNYQGTCSTIPLPRAGCLQYWETETRVRPIKGETFWLEVGVCAEKDMDMMRCVANRPHAYSLSVQYCPTHKGICRATWKEGEEVFHQPDTIPITDGTNTLHYGVVCDDAGKKIVFIDVKEKKVMSTLDNVDSSQPLWPMFGVYGRVHYIQGHPPQATANMRLVVGSDINMTEEKKAIIVNALS